MDLDWLDLAGRLSLVLFAALVTALLIIGATRTWRRHRTRHRPSLERILFEYVGNVACEGPETATADGESDERRDEGPRALLDEIIRELDRRRVPSREREPFLEELRGAIRSEERLQTAGLDGYDIDRRFLETQRWALAERFHAIVEDPPPEIVNRIRSGFATGTDP